MGLEKIMRLAEIKIANKLDHGFVQAGLGMADPA